MVQEAVLLKKEALWDCFIRKGCNLCRERGKAAGVQRSHGEGLLVDTKVLLENSPPLQEGEIGNHPIRVQQGWDTVDLH